MAKNLRPQSLLEVSRRAVSGQQPFDPAVREFLDAWQFMSHDGKGKAIVEEPVGADRLQNAYLAALGEYLADEAGLVAPLWTESPGRFLSRPFFAGGMDSLKAILLVESPPAFRRRLIFISADGLSRPKRLDAIDTSVSQ
jgi:hypothetical protein